MKYNIADIEGIGESYGSKLKEAGVNTVEELLNRGESAKGREELVEKTGIPSKLILKWVNHADLFRINGIGPQFAELLEAAGVDTVKELRHRVPAHLAEKVAQVNDEKHICHRVPSVSELERMIEEATTLEPRVNY